MRRASARPVVLVLGGNDPSGGAGLAADIETLASLGCHPAPVVTAITVQDSRDVRAFDPVAPGLVMAQARAVLDDLPVAAVKLGMLGSAACSAACAAILEAHPHLPLVVDPVLRAGGGGGLARGELAQAIRLLLVPRAHLLTPNRQELRRLAPEADSEAGAARALLGAGAGAVYVTGTDHTTGPQVVNRLYTPGETLELPCERLPGGYHGSGCTLAAAAAAGLAHGLEVGAAVRAAQDYTLRALRRAVRPGRGQAFPVRLATDREDQDD